MCSCAATAGGSTTVSSGALNSRTPTNAVADGAAPAPLGGRPTTVTSNVSGRPCPATDARAAVRVARLFVSLGGGLASSGCVAPPRSSPHLLHERLQLRKGGRR